MRWSFVFRLSQLILPSANFITHEANTTTYVYLFTLPINTHTHMRNIWFLAISVTGGRPNPLNRRLPEWSVYSFLPEIFGWVFAFTECVAGWRACRCILLTHTYMFVHICICTTHDICIGAYHKHLNGVAICLKHLTSRRVYSLATMIYCKMYTRLLAPLVRKLAACFFDSCDVIEPDPRAHIIAKDRTAVASDPMMFYVMRGWPAVKYAARGV